MFNLTKKFCKGAVLTAMISCSTSAFAADLGKMKMGIEPWLGYGLWHIAAEDKLFKKQGFEQVDVINFAEDKDINAALASGQIDAANIATHTAMGMIAAGLPVKVIMLLDQSETADALIVSSDIKSLEDLKGKSIAYEEGTTSDILLHSALSSIGLTTADIKAVPMPASNAGSALIAGQVPVSVTYEPYLTVAKNNDPSIKMLYSGASDPGLISDVLVVRQSVIDEHPEQISALIKVWAASMDSYNTDTKRGREIISKAVGASPEELSTAFDGVKYLDVAANKTMLAGEFKNDTFPHILKAANEAKIISADLSYEQVIDTSFIEKE